MRPFPLDLSSLSVGAEGVRNFLWPMSISEVKEFRDNLVRSLVDVTNKALSDGVRGAPELMAFQLYYFADLVTIYRAELLSARLEPLGWVVLPGESMPFWDSLLAGRSPEPPPILDQLRAGFPPKRFSHYLTKYRHKISKLVSKPAPKAAQAPRKTNSRDYLSTVSVPSKRIRHGRVNRQIIEQGVVATRRADIMSIMAAQEDRSVVLAEHRLWFRPVRGVAPAVMEPQLRSKVLQAVSGVFEQAGQPLPGFVADYAAGVLDQGTALCGVHLDRLRRSRLVPGRLWTGTCGNVWDRLLRIAVKERGGEVTGFSHSGGSEYRKDPYLAHKEYAAADRYVTYSRELVDCNTAQVDESLLYGPSKPEVVAPVLPSCKVRPPEQGRVDPAKVKSVMYVDNFIYGLDRMHMGPLIPDTVAVDWTARLLTQIREWGYEVIIKPHPGSRVPIHPEVVRLSGATVVTEPFEQALDRADLLLFDSQSSTTFNSALKTVKPMVYVDLGQWEWFPEALVAFTRRCPTVFAGPGEDNRLHVDWEALRAALVEAPARAGDTTFYNDFIRCY